MYLGAGQAEEASGLVRPKVKMYHQAQSGGEEEPGEQRNRGEGREKGRACERAGSVPGRGFAPWGVPLVQRVRAWVGKAGLLAWSWALGLGPFASYEVQDFQEQYLRHKYQGAGSSWQALPAQRACTLYALLLLCSTGPSCFGLEPWPCLGGDGDAVQELRLDLWGLGHRE